MLSAAPTLRRIPALKLDWIRLLRTTARSLSKSEIPLSPLRKESLCSSRPSSEWRCSMMPFLALAQERYSNFVPARGAPFQAGAARVLPGFLLLLTAALCRPFEEGVPLTISPLAKRLGFGAAGGPLFFECGARPRR